MNRGEHIIENREDGPARRRRDPVLQRSADLGCEGRCCRSPRPDGDYCGAAPFMPGVQRLPGLCSRRQRRCINSVSGSVGDAVAGAPPEYASQATVFRRRHYMSKCRYLLSRIHAAEARFMLVPKPSIPTRSCLQAGEPS